VITYDRRGNSRSAAGQTSTTLEQQADDALALIQHLGGERASVFATSGGAIIALKLALRHPEAAAHFVVHEPPFLGVLPDGEQLGRQLTEQVKQSLDRLGPEGTMELFLRDNAGSETFDRLEPALRKRMLANGPWFFGSELAMFTSWIPGETELRSLRVPVRVLAGAQDRGVYYHRAAEWLAAALGVELIEIVGAHAPYLTTPQQFAAMLAPLLETGPAFS